MSDLLTKEAILKAPDIQTQEVEVPEWGGKVLVKGMTGTQRDLYEKSVLVQKGKNMTVNLDGARAKMLVICIVDTEGKQIFSQMDIHDLGAKSAVAVNRVAKVAQKLSGIGDEEIEELAGGLDKALRDNSTSD